MLKDLVRKGMFVLLMTFCSWALFTGCPSNTNTDGGTPDGGTTDKGPAVSAKCEKGTLCIDVSNSNARSCEVVFKSSKALTATGVGFHESVVGRSMFRGSKLAVAFLLQKDAAIATDVSAAVIRLTEGVAGLELEKATCYDRKGAKIDGESVKTRKP